MKRSTINSAKKPRRGRPPVESEAVNVRMPADALRSLDDWRHQQDDLPVRPEAIRRLVEIGLSVRAKPKGNLKQTPTARHERANELAAQAIDRVSAGSPDNDEKASRKRRLIKGPAEFREVRLDAEGTKDGAKKS